MKRIMLIATASLCVIAMGGCYSPRKMGLNAGEKIIFSTTERATQFRQASGNDAYSTNRVVEITRPTLVLCE